MNEIWVAKDKVNENWWRYQPETTLTPLKKIISSVISSSCSHISIGLEHVYVRISSFTPKVQTDEFLLGSNPRTLKIKTAAKIHEDCNVNEAWWGGGGECVLSMWRHRVEDPICDDTLTWEVWFESELKFCNANATIVNSSFFSCLFLLSVLNRKRYQCEVISPGNCRAHP